MSNQEEFRKLYEKFQNTVWVIDEDPTGQKEINEMYQKMKEMEDVHAKKYNEFIKKECKICEDE